MGIQADKIIAVRTSKTVYRDGETVLKVFDHGYSKADVLNEALNQARIEQTSLNIPRILEVLKLDGKWAIRLEYIPGKTLGRLMEEQPERKAEYLEQLVKLQLLVHSQTAPLLGRLKDKMAREISECDLAATERYELLRRLEETPLNKKVCHGDFSPYNVIITPDGEPYIIDWSHASQGCDAADAALTFLLFKLEGDEQAAESYIEMFCEMSGNERQAVESWLPLVAAAQSLKVNAKERALLLSMAK